MASKPNNSPHPQTSGLRFYSMGVVAANKLRTSKIIEVTPIEHLPFVDGQLTNTGSSIAAQGTDVNGAAYNTQVATAVTIQADWLPEGSCSRVTAPDVRRGEYVKLYQYADADKYYWTTSGLPKQRKLETQIDAWSGSADESADLDHTNSYYRELSTHDGHITWHTSKANGEFTTYDIQLNTKEGYFRFQDGVGNSLVIDSTQNLFQYSNSDGSILQVLKNTMLFKAPESVDFETKRMTVNASDQFNLNTKQSTIVSTNTTIKSTTVHNGDFTENGAFGLNGDMTTNASAAGGPGTSGSGKISIAGNMNLLGSATIQENLAVQGTISSPNQVDAPDPD
jgi:hypothetical protein